MVLVVIPLEELSATDLIVTGFGLVRLTFFRDKTNGGRIPRGKPRDRQPVSGKLRRKLVSVPGLAARYNRWGIPREQRRLSCERKLRLWAPATSARIARCALPTRNSPMSSWWTWWRVFRNARGSIEAERALGAEAGGAAKEGGQWRDPAPAARAGVEAEA